MTTVCRAFWLEDVRKAALRQEALKGEPADGEVEIETLYSGISRGSEALVAAGRVPESEHATMRAPLQAGAFPFPVKYGYAAVGRLASGREAGRPVFCLHPHQDRFRAPAAMVVPVPDDVPPARAVLGANMETALNAVWDAGIAPGDRIAVVGGGVVGCLVAFLAARMPGTRVQLVDIDAGRAAIADRLDVPFSLPEDATGEADVVFHASASADGLASAVDLAGMEARIVEMSWYGAGTVAAPLGGRFHSHRLTLSASQVGHVPPHRRGRWTNRRRLETALTLLADARLDALVSEETPFEALPESYFGILAAPDTLCHRIRYS